MIPIVLSSQLYGVTPYDPLTSVLPLLLFLVAVLACIIPALRAARLDPQRLFRGE